MKKTIVLLTLLLIFLIPSPTNAKIIQGEKVIIKSNEVVNDDLFIVGSSVQIDGKVNGDVYAAGENVVVNGVVSGDVYAAGAKIDITGMVGDDVVIAGAKIKVKKAIIGDSLITFGGSVSIDKDTDINGGVIFGAGEYQYSARANRGMVGGAGTAEINGTVEKNLYLRADDLTLGSKFATLGDVNYYSESRANIDNTASVGGEVHFSQINTDFPKQLAKQRAITATGFEIFSYLSALLVGLLILRFFGNFSQLISDKIEQKFWSALGWGLIGLFLTIPVILLIMLRVKYLLYLMILQLIVILH